MPYIYQIINSETGAVYVGATTRTPKKRFNEHLRDSRRFPHRKFYSDINAFGAEKFVLQTLEECGEEELSEREEYWIKKFDTFVTGNNETKGGQGKKTKDYSDVVGLYLSGAPISLIAKESDMCLDSVEKYIKAAGLSRDSSLQYHPTAKSVSAYDPFTKEFVKDFPSYRAAARWLIDTGKLRCKESGLCNHISDCAKGIRKTVGGYTWL